MQSCIYTLVPLSVNYSLMKASVGGRNSEANLRDYLASVFTNIEQSLLLMVCVQIAMKMHYSLSPVASVMVT